MRHHAVKEEVTMEFDISVVKKGRKEYQCFGCLEKIPKGVTHLVMKNVKGGKFSADRICVRCGFICTRKTKNQGSLLYGELQEHLLANCLRKEWKEILKTGKYIVRKQIAEPAVTEQKEPVTCAIIGKSQYAGIASGRRRFAFIRQFGKYTLDHFAAGKTVRLRCVGRGKFDSIDCKILKSKYFNTKETMKSIGVEHPHFALYIQNKNLEEVKQ